jgi:hypothetical protein
MNVSETIWRKNRPVFRHFDVSYELDSTHLREQKNVGETIARTNHPVSSHFEASYAMGSTHLCEQKDG